MIITAMYLFGIINHVWNFSWLYGLLAFIMDLVMFRGLNINIGSNDKEELEE